MTLTEKLQGLVESYEPIADAQERMALVVDAARGRKHLRAEECTEERKVAGCVSRAYLAVELREGKLWYRCAADSPLVLGLLSALCDFFSGAEPVEIAASEADPLGALGLTRHLSPTRQAGLASARKRIALLARAAETPR
jgi:cysteine desulfuration protein SufE